MRPFLTPDPSPPVWARGIRVAQLTTRAMNRLGGMHMD